MRIDLSILEQQFARISTSAKVIETLSWDLEELPVASRSGLPFAILVLAESIREANRKVEAELREIMDYYDMDHETIDLEVSVRRRNGPEETGR